MKKNIGNIYLVSIESNSKNYGNKYNKGIYKSLVKKKFGIILY